ncbi:carboxylesterase/lipase family protein [uncultured Caulobacter sp.]|uniref:carboxylesterase/lipase family protein n=1 Tax=uncultured Caulobacter sp. TaxID=158749 RepID=UPI00261005B6|nr:carboxylesterase/lipase family protein [uncultured Caulobacter sp.]
MPLDRRAVLAGTAALAASPRVNAAGRAAPVASTLAGRVRGAELDGIKVFKGVRYGADTSSRRFQPAEAAQPWKGVVDALAYGPASPQLKADEPTSEDCLFLNVWTPGLADGKPRPVMFYVHGGAHANGSGSSPLYDGTWLAKTQDVVVVTVNHRLNAFGYAYLARLGGPELADSGNVGNLDLILALRWVRDNIAAFGGDPGNVMIFGQSGGGAKCVTLMAMPRAAGLYHKVATMSGQHVTAMGPIHATIRARAFMEKLGLKPDQTEALKTLPAGQLVEALKMRDPLERKGGIVFWSVVDHGVLARHPFYPDAPRESGHIPMIIGNTHDETKAFLGGDPKNFALTWDELPARLEPELVLDVAPERVIARYRQLYPNYSPSDVFFAATTAGRSWPGHLIQAERRAAIGAPAWMYQLDFGAQTDPRMGAYHGYDIALVFGTLDAKGSMTGTSAAARKVSGLMSDAFVNFARTGDPNGPTVPAWEKYVPPRRPTLVIDETSRMVDDPRKEERELFSVAPFLKEGT